MEIKVIVFGNGNVKILTKQGEKKTTHEVYYVEGRKTITKMLHLVYMEYNHCVINDIQLSNKVSGKSTNENKSLVSFEDKARHGKKI